jgi:hypothetical protein
VNFDRKSSSRTPNVIGLWIQFITHGEPNLDAEQANASFLQKSIHPAEQVSAASGGLCVHHARRAHTFSDRSDSSKRSVATISAAPATRAAATTRTPIGRIQ